MANSAYLLQKMNTYFGTLATYGALVTGDPGTTGGTEIFGGSPAYVRKPPTWGTATTAIPSVMAATGMTFDGPSGATVGGYQNMDALTAGHFLNGPPLTPNTFSSQFQVTVTPQNSQG